MSTCHPSIYSRVLHVTIDDKFVARHIASCRHASSLSILLCRRSIFVLKIKFLICVVNVFVDVEPSVSSNVTSCARATNLCGGVNESIVRLMAHYMNHVLFSSLMTQHLLKFQIFNFEIYF